MRHERCGTCDPEEGEEEEASRDVDDSFESHLDGCWFEGRLEKIKSEG